MAEYWPPDALRPDTLGQLYNEAYEHAACQEGLSPEEAHQAACAAVHRHGHDHAKAAKDAPRGHSGPVCACTDASCVSVVTRASLRTSAEEDVS